MFGFACVGSPAEDRSPLARNLRPDREVLLARTSEHHDPLPFCFEIGKSSQGKKGVSFGSAFAGNFASVPSMWRPSDFVK